MQGRLIQFEDLSGPVRFRDCDDLVEATRSILHGWRVQEVVAGDVRPVMRLCRTRDGAYRRITPRHATPSRVRDKTRVGVVAGVCGLHYELIDWYCDEHADRLFVHGAAVEVRGRLLVFPATTRAGKSTLSIYLAMAGARVYCDDVLPIETGSADGIGFGILPRLRRARPGAESEAFQRFVRERRGLASRNRIYVDLRPDLLAPLGAAAPIRAIVLLDRHPEGRSELCEVEKSDALEQIIVQNFALAVPAPTILDTLHAVIDQSDCYRLRFANPAEAADLIMDAFDREPESP